MSSNTVDRPMGQYKRHVGCPIKNLEFVKLVPFSAATPPCGWIAMLAFCVCSHMTGTHKMGAFTSHNPSWCLGDYAHHTPQMLGGLCSPHTPDAWRAMLTTPPRCLEGYAHHTPQMLGGLCSPHTPDAHHTPQMLGGLCSPHPPDAWRAMLTTTPPRCLEGYASHTPPRCYHKYMFSAILSSFNDMTIVHTHISGWGLPGIPMDIWRQI